MAKLREDYEVLRATATSRVKIPSQPLGLDLWLKKGFLAWIITMLQKEPTTQLSFDAVGESVDIPGDLVISLSNILTEMGR